MFCWWAAGFTFKAPHFVLQLICVSTGSFFGFLVSVLDVSTWNTFVVEGQASSQVSVSETISAGWGFSNEKMNEVCCTRSQTTWAFVWVYNQPERLFHFFFFSFFFLPQKIQQFLRKSLQCISYWMQSVFL